MCGFLLAFLCNPSFSLPLPGNPFSCQQEPEECAVYLPSHSSILLTFPPPSCNSNRPGSALHPADEHYSVEYFQIKGLLQEAALIRVCSMGVRPWHSARLSSLLAGMHVILICYKVALFPSSFLFQHSPVWFCLFGVIS